MADGSSSSTSSSGGGGDLFSQGATVLLLAALPISSLVAVHNLSQWRIHPQVARQKRPVLLFTTALAVLAALTATLAFAAPRRMVPILAPAETNTMAYMNFALSPPWVGVAAVLFGAAALAMDGVFTLHLYCVGHKLEFGTEPARWQIYLAHFYIWVLFIVPWVVLFAPTQVMLRAHNGVTRFQYNWGNLILNMLFFFASFLLHILVSIGMALAFVRSLNRLTDSTHLDETRVKDLTELTIKSAIYVGACLALKVCLYTALLSYPWCVKADVLTTPFLLAQLLLVHCCFNIRYGAKRAPQGKRPGRRWGRWHWSNWTLGRSGRQQRAAPGQTTAGGSAPTPETSGVGAGSSLSSSGGSKGGRRGSGPGISSPSSINNCGGVAALPRALFRISERTEDGQSRSSQSLSLASSLRASGVAVSSPPLSLESGLRRSSRIRGEDASSSSSWSSCSPAASSPVSA